MSAPTEAESADYELLVDRADVLRYLAGAGILSRLTADTDNALDVDVIEVTAGNMNRVFLAKGSLGSVALKQAPPWVQVVGPEWPVDPARIASEARAYELLAGLVPDAVPSIELVDLDRYIMVMEDLSDLTVLRDVLVEQLRATLAGEPATALDFVSIGDVVGRFVAELSLATSAAGMPAAERDALIIAAANPELCAMTEAVVLDEPYREHEHNHWLPELDAEVRALYTDTKVLDSVAGIRWIFQTRAEALIHGDLHSGSVMVGWRDGEQAAKIFDPEFSFVGPIGMDLGLFWANLTLASIAARSAGHTALADARASAIPASWREFSRIVTERWPDRLAAPLDDDGAPLELDAWLARIRSDAWGFAGVESVRRVAGFSHAADLTSLPAEARLAGHAELLKRARGWIVDRTDPSTDTLPSIPTATTPSASTTP